jgi:hypothetical protein
VSFVWRISSRLVERLWTFAFFGDFELWRFNESVDLEFFGSVPINGRRWDMLSLRVKRAIDDVFRSVSSEMTILWATTPVTFVIDLPRASDMIVLNKTRQ